MWEVNARGETYGPEGNGPDGMGQPDLVLVIADDGQTIGYVRQTDIDGDLPSSPEEALTQQEARGDASRQIPVCTRATA